MAADAAPWLEEAFESAKKNFLKSLANPKTYDFSKIHSIDDVYNATDEIQKQQAKTKTLRGLNKLKPFIDGLNQYAGTIEIFIQAKAEILSLIWGPLKLLLQVDPIVHSDKKPILTLRQVASSVITVFEKVVAVLADIGNALPIFKKYAEIFQQNEEVKRVLGLFYSDILEVYTILLNFLTHRKRNIFFESLWPNIRGKLAVVQENIHQHKLLMTSQVTLEHVLQASQARGKAVDEYEKAQQARDDQHFSNLLAEFAPHMYDSKLADILQRSSVASGKWLRSNDDFRKWLDPLVGSKRCIWLHGIPGSGKTVLTANIIRNLMNPDTQVAFVFLTYEDQELAGGIPVFHSLIFQLLSQDCLARPIFFEAVKTHGRKLASDPDCAQKVLIDVLQNIINPFIILDGLDEANEERRTWLLNSMLEILRDCPGLKLLISSRREEGMLRILKNCSASIKIDDCNGEDIREYAKIECGKWLNDLKHDGAERQMYVTASHAMESVVERSLGMFLYTKLVFDVLKDQGSAQDIQNELENLPDGLDQAYGRVHAHFTRNMSKTARDIVKNILQWIACAFRPLRTEEVLQILMIEPGAKDFTKGLRYARSIRLLCGPIIEEANGVVHFVHFSAKGYFLGDQSQGFLRLSEAHLNAALVCSTYLSFASLDPAFDTTSENSDVNDDLNSKILSGSFVFLGYAATEWVEHVKACNLGISSLDAQKLCEELSRLYRRRAAHIKPVDPRQKARVGFESFPEVRDWLVMEDLDWQKIQHGLSDECDLLAISGALPISVPPLKRFRKQLEILHNNRQIHQTACSREKLQRMYGICTFYCNLPSCNRFRQGFEDTGERDQHQVTHIRAHKCEHSQCIYHILGFRSEGELGRHVQQCHKSLSAFNVNRKTQLNSNAQLQHKEDLLEALQDAVLQNDAKSTHELVSSLLIAFEVETPSPETVISLVGLAARVSTVEIFTQVSQPFKPFLEMSQDEACYWSLIAAIEAENIPVMSKLLADGVKTDEVVVGNNELSFYRKEERRCLFVGDLHHSRPRRKGMGTHVPALFHLFSLWNPTLMHHAVENCGMQLPKEKSYSGYIFWAPGFVGSDILNARRRVNAMKKYVIWPEAWNQGLDQAFSGRSVLALRICLENGADPNYRESAGKKPILWDVVMEGSCIAAEMVKVLVEYGVETDIQHKRLHLTDLKGYKRIEKHFGASWAETVDRIRSEVGVNRALPEEREK